MNLNPANFHAVVELPDPHPDHAPGITREVACYCYTHFHDESGERFIKLFTRCYHFKDGVPYASSAVRNFERPLLSKSSLLRMVDPLDGMVVLKDETDPANIVYRRADDNSEVMSPVDQYAFFHARTQNASMVIKEELAQVILLEHTLSKTYDKPYTPE